MKILKTQSYFPKTDYNRILTPKDSLKRIRKNLNNKLYYICTQYELIPDRKSGTKFKTLMAKYQVNYISKDK